MTATRQAKAEMVRRLVLVVHHRHGWNSRRPRRDDLCVRAVRERDVRASPLRKAYKLRVRAANVVAFCNRPGGLPPPIGITSGHCSRARSSVCAWSRAVKTTSQPSRCSRSTTGVNTSTWGVFARSIQIRRRGSWSQVTRRHDRDTLVLRAVRCRRTSRMCHPGSLDDGGARSLAAPERGDIS